MEDPTENHAPGPESAGVPDVSWLHVRCPLCAADAPRELLIDRVRAGGTVFEFHVVECSECAFLYVTPRGTGAVFGNLSGGAARRDAAVANRPIYANGISRLRQAGLPDGGIVLDLGCARGDFMDHATRAGYAVVGVDLSHALASQARERGFEVHTGDLREIDLGSDHDALTMWDVIEHVDDPVGLLTACRQVLRPGGLVLFHTGNARFQIPKARLLTAVRPSGGPYLIPFQHLTHFDQHSSRRALAAAGFEPVSVSFAGTLHYRRAWKRAAMATLNLVGTLPPYFGGPLLTNAMAAVGRRPLS